MANPANTTNLTVSEETYNRLKKIKQIKGWTFNQLIDTLCELELQNNYVDQIINYELLAFNKIYPFRITFKKDNMLIEYRTPTGYSLKISDWGVKKSIERKFFEFINEECARCIFQNMPMGLMFEEFDIYKIG